MGTSENNNDELFESLKHLLRKETEEETAARLKQEDAWKAEYSRKTFTERVEYWSGEIYRNMRWQGESTGDEYSWLSPEWYQDIKTFEPEIDGILIEVTKKLGMMFNADAFYRAIGQSRPG